MELLYRRCAGLDVHKDTVVACARVVGEGGTTEEVETFGTTTKALLELSAWLSERECTHVAMESTGVYWKPVWHVLENDFELVLANAAHVRNVPGRKSDVSDAVWLADLLAHGLVRSSFVPPKPVQELRELTRTRKQLVRERVKHVQRLQKVLEDANVKLASFISDIMGATGKKMLRALIDGETEPDKLAVLADVRIKASRKQLSDALRGRVTAHHRFMLKLHLTQIEHLDQAIASLEGKIGEALAPFRQAADQLTTIPGVSETAASVLVSEIGVDMSRFPSAAHLVSWAGLCPRMDESAGKRRSTRLRKGAPWLKALLVQCAWSAVRTHNTYLRTQYYRIRNRRGPKKAIMAVAASILTAAYHMLRDGTFYEDLGADYFDTLDEARVVERLQRRLIDLGYDVQIRKAA